MCQFVVKTRVTDLDIGDETDRDITVRSITMVQDGKEKKVEVRPQDIVIATLGSMVAIPSWHKRFPADGDRTPKHERVMGAVADALPKAQGRVPRSSVFTDHVDESTFISYTVTQNDPLFFKLMEELREQQARQERDHDLPTFPLVPDLHPQHPALLRGAGEGTFVWYGISLYPEKVGELVRKPMNQCSGKEILEEMIGHLAFDAHEADSGFVDRQPEQDAVHHKPVPGEEGDCRPPVIPKDRPTWASPVSSSKFPTIVSSRWNIRCAAPRSRPSHWGILTKNPSRSHE